MDNGLVMLDNEYYFKVDSKQYIFGKKSLIKDESSPNCGVEVQNDLLYPSTLSRVIDLYFHYKTADLAADKILTLEEFSEIVKQVDEKIKDIKKIMEVASCQDQEEL